MKEQIERFIHLISMEYDSGITVIYEDYQTYSRYLEIITVIEIDNKEYHLESDVSYNDYRIDFTELYDNVREFIQYQLLEKRKSL